MDRAVNQGPWLQERFGGGRRGWDGSFKEGAEWVNFATCVVFLTFLMRTKRRKLIFFEGYPVGWGGVQGLGRGGPGALGYRW